MPADPDCFDVASCAEVLLHEAQGPEALRFIQENVRSITIRNASAKEHRKLYLINVYELPLHSINCIGAMAFVDNDDQPSVVMPFIGVVPFRRFWHSPRLTSVENGKKTSSRI